MLALARLISPSRIAPRRRVVFGLRTRFQTCSTFSSKIPGRPRHLQRTDVRGLLFSLAVMVGVTANSILYLDAPHLDEEQTRGQHNGS
jgi:hypothetical protein